MIFLAMRLVTILTVITAGTPWAATYYVAKSGNDSNPGTEVRPWLTIQKAADTLLAGDTVYVKAGTYKESVTAQNSGAPGQYITYAAYGNDVVVLDGENIRPVGPDRWGGLFNIDNNSYIRVRGLRAINSRFAGFFARLGSHHIVFEKNSTYMTWSSGIAAWGCSDITIDGNTVQRACQGDGATQECITVSGCNTFEIRNNHVYDRLVEVGNGGEGICSKDADRNGKVYNNHVHDLYRLGIYVDAQATLEDGIEVFGNIVHDTQSGIVLAAELTSGILRNVRVYNNILYDNRLHGIEISDADGGLAAGGDGAKQNLTIINNTVYHNGHNAQGWGGGISIVSKNPGNSNLVVRNNLCSQNGQWQILRSIVTEPKTTVNYNLIDGPNEYDDGEDRATSGTSYKTGSPLFVNAAGQDYRLRAGSPAIDAGSAASAPLVDYAGTARPKDGDGNGSALFDIGAYEFQLLPASARFWKRF